MPRESHGHDHDVYSQLVELSEHLRNGTSVKWLL